MVHAMPAGYIAGNTQGFWAVMDGLVFYFIVCAGGIVVMANTTRVVVDMQTPQQPWIVKLNGILVAGEYRIELCVSGLAFLSIRE